MSLYTEMCDDNFFIVENLKNEINSISLTASDFDIDHNYNESFETEGENIFRKFIDAVKAIAARVIKFIKDMFARIKEFFKPQKETIIAMVKDNPELGGIKVEATRLHDVEELIKSRDDVRRAIMRDIAKGKTVTADDVDNALKKCNRMKKIRTAVIAIGTLVTALGIFATASFYKDRADNTEECEDIVERRLNNSLDENPDLINAYNQVQNSWAEDIKFASMVESQNLTVIKDTLTRLKNHADVLSGRIKINREMLKDDIGLANVAAFANTTVDNIRADYTRQIKNDQNKLNNIATKMQENIDKYNSI